ncbi:MAG: DnaA regulatory inactivator Hda [Azoarcus sp.]|jgi:DnaA family protein|nr:DnaA regulatory inactivator Hda [Azoarcus sp.]
MVKSTSSYENLEFYLKSRFLVRLPSVFPSALSHPFHSLSMRQLILDLLPENPPGLDNFVPGGNAEVIATLSAWGAPECPETSLLLYGESGSGKTHLLRACAADYHDALATPGLEEISALDDTPRRVAVDNVEALSCIGQIALFDLFNRLRATGGRLLTAASEPPQGLSLREDLRTRLGSGLVYRLIPLTDEEKRAVLEAQAAARALALPAGALDYLLVHARRDMRHLMSILVALDRYSLEHKRPITLPLLREVLLHSGDRGQKTGDSTFGGFAARKP